MNTDEMFDPYERLIGIRIEGKPFRVPENNTILRCLQYLDVEGVSDAELCWNGECLNCQVSVREGERVRSVMACRAVVNESMEIVGISDELRRAANF